MPNTKSLRTLAGAATCAAALVAAPSDDAWAQDRAPAAPSAAAGRAPARGVARGDSLRLVDALRLTLALSPTLRTARQQVDASRGGVAIADAALDPRFRTTAAANRESTLGFSGADVSAVPGVLAARERSASYSVALETPLPWGVVLVPEVGLSQIAALGHGAVPVNRATAGARLVVPLLRNRAGAAIVATQHAAERTLDATEADLRQVVAQTTLRTALAYWDYGVAGERVRVLQATEERARRLVDETAELVRGDARPAADLQQVRGNLASKRAQRIGAEQALAEARQQLGITLGLAPDAIALLPPATLDTATLASLPVDGGLDVDARARTWAARADGDALARRPDVAAAASRRRAAEAQVGAAAQELRGRLDLSVGMTYAGLDRGTGLDGFVAPLYRNTRGAAATLQLQYELPARNLAARGRALQATAAYEQTRIAERDLARQVTSALAVAAAGVTRGRLTLAEAAEAVRLARVVVDNEREKFRLGVATQIDVVYAEDALVSALLAEVGARRNYAAAVGTLRFQAGELAAAGADADLLAALLTGAPPAPDARPASPSPASQPVPTRSPR